MTERRPTIDPMPAVATGCALPWDAPLADPVLALAEARRDLGDTFVVDSGDDRYLFTFSPTGVSSFYALPEELASKGVADWRMLRRKLPDEVFARPPDPSPPAVRPRRRQPLPRQRRPRTGCHGRRTGDGGDDRRVPPDPTARPPGGPRLVGWPRGRYRGPVRGPGGGLRHAGRLRRLRAPRRHGRGRRIGQGGRGRRPGRRSPTRSATRSTDSPGANRSTPCSPAWPRPGPTSLPTWPPGVWPATSRSSTWHRCPTSSPRSGGPWSTSWPTPSRRHGWPRGTGRRPRPAPSSRSGWRSGRSCPATCSRPSPSTWGTPSTWSHPASPSPPSSPSPTCRRRRD